MSNGDVIIKFSADDKVTPAIKKQIEEVQKLKKEYDKLEASRDNLKADKQRILNLDVDSDIASIKKLQDELRELKEQYSTADSKSKARESIKIKQRELTALLTKEITKQTIALKRQKQTIRDTEIGIKKLTTERNRDALATKREKREIDKANVSRSKENAIRRSATTSLIRHIRQVESLVVAYYAMSRVINLTATKGILLNKTIEDGQVGIAALIAANTEGGNSAERFSAALAISADTILKIKKASVETAATFPQLTEVFQQAIGGALGAGKAMGQSVDEIIQHTIKLSQRMTNIAGAIGMPMEQVSQEIRAIMEGTITKDARIAKMLGITTKDINDAKKNVGGLFDYLNKQLEVFDVLEGHITFSKLVARFSDSLDTIRMEANKPIFEGLKLSIADATQYLKKHQEEIIQKYQEMVRGIINGAGFIVDAFSGVKLVLREIEKSFHYLVKGILEVDNLSRKFFNSYISFRNKIATFTGSKKWTPYELNNIGYVDKQIKDTKKQIDDLVKSMNNGRNISKALLDNINKITHPDNFSQWKSLRNIDVGLDLKSAGTLSQIDKIASDARHILSPNPAIDTLNKKYEPIFARLDNLMKDTNKDIANDAKKTAKLVRQAYEKELSKLSVSSKAINLPISQTFKTWESLRHINIKDIETQKTREKQAKLTYLETTNQYTSVWNMKEEDLRAKYAGLLTPEEIDAIVEKYKTDYFKPLEDMSKTTASYMENVFDTMNKSLTTSFDSFFDYTSKGFMKFGDLASAVLHDVYMQIMKTSVINPMVSGIMGGITSLFTPMNVAPNLALSLKGYAHGDVFTPFATGGAFTNSIVTEPTPFAYGGNFGNLGVMGEAGSEAVMPLTRHRNGDLGVKATPSNVIINVENQSGIPVDMKQVSEVMNDDGTKTINIVMNAIERNPDFRQAIKGIR